MKYKILILKGFPGHWRHKNLSYWLKENNLDGKIIRFGIQIRKVDYYVNKLKKLIDNKYPNEKIILIGFSMGGLIAVRFAQKYCWKNISEACPFGIEKIITVATPFKGSIKASRFKMLPATRDMSPESKLLKEIRDAKIPKNKLICVSGATDNLVDNSGTYLTGNKHITLNVHGHINAQLFKNIKPVLESELLKYNNDKK